SEDSQLMSDKEEKDNDGDADNDEDEDDDHIRNIQDTDDEDEETESDDDEIYMYKIQVHKDADVEMVGAETVERENKEEDEMTDAAKSDVEKTAEEKGDAELAGNAVTSDYQVKVSIELPLPSSSLSVSSRFGTHFLNLSSDISLTGVLKDFAKAKISSLMDVHIQQETSHIQSASILKVPVSVIPKTTTLPPIPEIPTETSVSTALSPLHLKKIDHFAESLASLKSYVPMVIEHYLGFKIGDDLQKVLQRHTADLIQKYSVKLTPEPSKIQKPTIDLVPESEKSALEICKIKKEQAEKQKMAKYTIKSTNQAALKEYDLKSALYQTMNEKKSFNINLANHALYHALMEALIEDENTMDKGITDTVKNHKRKHDDDKDDNEDPSAGPNQGKKTKRRRTKESDSSMKPSTTKEISKGKASSKSSKTDKFATTNKPIKEPIAEVVMDEQKTTANEDVVSDVDHPQYYVAPKTNKLSRDTWFKQPPRPPTPDPEWNKRQVVTVQPEQPWFNHMVYVVKDPLTFDELMATPNDFSKYAMNRLKIDHLTKEILVGPIYNLLKGTCTSSIELEYNMEECFKALTDRLDWNNLEGDCCPFDLAKPLPLKGCLSHLTVAAEYFFNTDLEFLKSCDLKKKYTTSITKTKAAWYEIVGIKDMVPTL
ncbi:hypothetical protein Tco_1050122, partial [Tanacetum coccineum]